MAKPKTIRTKEDLAAISGAYTAEMDLQNKSVSGKIQDLNIEDLPDNALLRPVNGKLLLLPLTTDDLKQMNADMNAMTQNREQDMNQVGYDTQKRIGRIVLEKELKAFHDSREEKENQRKKEVKESFTEFSEEYGTFVDYIDDLHAEVKTLQSIIDMAVGIGMPEEDLVALREFQTHTSNFFWRAREIWHTKLIEHKKDKTNTRRIVVAGVWTTIVFLVFTILTAQPDTVAHNILKSLTLV